MNINNSIVYNAWTGQKTGIIVDIWNNTTPVIEGSNPQL